MRSRTPCSRRRELAQRGATAGGVQDLALHIVNIVLSDSISFNGLRVTSGDLQGVDVLIGMDIISMGDLAITHKSDDNTLVMSYRTPPDYGRVIDFELDLNS